MSFLGPTELKKVLSTSLIITDGEGNNLYNEARVEEAAYALSLGNEAYRTDNKDRKIEILDEKSRNIEINPGQFTLLMTDEYICVPKDKLAFISIKAKQKLKGLINVSGFHVDPGFEGKLLFSVYNAGPSTITLQTKEPYFLIWFAKLESEADGNDAYNGTKNHHQGQKNIKPDYIDALKGGDIASPNTLLDLIKQQEANLTTEMSKMRSHLNSKITDTERKYLNIDYLFKLIIGVAIALFVRYLFMEAGPSHYASQLIAKDSVINLLQRDIQDLKNNSLSLNQIDSLVNRKISMSNDN